MHRPNKPYILKITGIPKSDFRLKTLLRSRHRKKHHSESESFSGAAKPKPVAGVKGQSPARVAGLP